MTPSTSIDRDTFLGYVRESGLMTADQIRRSLASAPVSERGRVVARSFVEQGVLTRFQAERLLAGRTEGFFVGPYLILDLIGRGGMGRVFKAEHSSMGRVVALKVLPSQVMKTQRARQLFDREVRAAASVSHPNIVTAFDASQSGDLAYLAMEFINGPNLHDFVKLNGPMPVTQACDVIRQAATGLAFAHQLGIVHRDIKPANLLLQPTPGSTFTVKILDFGLARLASNDAEQGRGGTADSIEGNAQAVIGTPDYLSPEQARDIHLADARSDLYSLGCTFYYLLIGQVPFPGGTSIEKLLRHATDEPTLIEALRPDVPPNIAAIVRLLMAKNPAHRFASCEPLVDALSPHTQANHDSWVRIEAPPIANPTLPNTGAYSRSVVAESPWAAMTVDQTVSATLPDTGGSTSVHRLPRDTPRRGKAGWLWQVVTLAVMVGVIAGVIGAIKYLVNLATGAG